MPTLDINGQTLHYQDTGGSGPVLVFLHGFLFDHTMFAAQVEALSADYRCISVDTRGFGQTVWDGKEFTLYDVVSDVIGLLDALKLEKVTIIGMSQGAYATVRLAIKHPERVRALVLMSTRKDILSDEFQANYASLRDYWGQGDDNSFFIESLMSMLIGPKDRFSTVWEQWHARWEAFDHNHMFHTINALLAKEILTDEQIASIKVPVLSIHGMDDRGTPVALADQLYALFPNGKGTVRIKGAAHAVNMTHPNEIYPALRAFLDEYAQNG
ncbi:MAG: alpha/beta hydrolase [Anaerolineae bacterium]|jgi:pimeloyl-ACP methyl ester carboxylesterase|nr:alpha/beta hydrolase [Anaerolineae bacterium]